VAPTQRTVGIAVSAALLASVVFGAPGFAQGAIADGAKSVEFDWGTFTLAQRIIDKVANGEPVNIVIDNQGTAIPPFGIEQRIGTERACANNTTGLEAVCSLRGPALTDATAQLTELETMLAGNEVDCLGLQSPPGAFLDVIDKYVDAGIPVFTQNTDVPGSKRFAQFRLDERNSGRVNGEVTASLLQELGATPSTVGMGSGDPAGQWAQERGAGFMEGIASVFPDATFAQDDKSLLPVGAPDFTPAQAVEQAGPYLQGNEDVNLFFHTDQGVEGVATVIEQQGKIGQVWTSGFNVSGPILDSIDKGAILVTINQGFDNQAEAAANACLDFLANGNLPADPDGFMSPVVITKDGGEGRQTTEEARVKLNEVLAAGG
jgi:ribose transport system substrate-binding protein